MSDWPFFCQTHALADGTWVHIEPMDLERERGWLVDRLVDPILVHTLTEWFPKPSAREYETGYHLVIKAPNLAGSDAVDDMIALRLYRTQGLLLTMALKPLESVRGLKERDDLTGLDADRMVGEMVQQVTGRLRRAVSDVVDRLDDLEDRIVNPDIAVTPGELLTLRRKVIAYKRAMGAQSAALYDVAAMRAFSGSNAAATPVKRSAQTAAKLDDLLETLRQRTEGAATALDALSRKTSERFSYLLTLAAGIFLPINLLAGLFGANVGGVPWSDTPDGFLYLCLTLVGTGAATTVLSVLLLRRLARGGG